MGTCKTPLRTPRNTQGNGVFSRAGIRASPETDWSLDSDVGMASILPSCWWESPTLQNYNGQAKDPATTLISLFLSHPSSGLSANPTSYTSKIHPEIEHFPAPSMYFQGPAKYLTHSSHAIMICWKNEVNCVLSLLFITSLTRLGS